MEAILSSINYNASAALLPLTRPYSHPTRGSLRVLKSSHMVPAAKPAAIDQVTVDPIIGNTKSKVGNNILACPICYERVTWNDTPDTSLESIARSTLKCNTCGKSYYGNKISHVDLTIGGNMPDEPLPASIELFRLPFIAFLYERGWRQCFSFGGFPGPEKEFDMIKDYLKPVLGGNIIDASCGSGMFSRLFAQSGLFSHVIALDFSETMLKQCYEFVKHENNFPESNLTLVRADVSRLPFGSASVDAVHAGAALHCWPSPSAAVAEISRVLKPGGLLVATTYVFDHLPQILSLTGPLRQNLARVTGMHFYLHEKELRDLCSSCGLVDFKCSRSRNFIMISAAKPVN